MKKMPSFTIMELVMTSLISTIIISIVYYSYSMVSIQFSRYNTRSSSIKNFYLLTTAMHEDFEKANWVTDSLSGSFILCRSGDLQTSYFISHSSIVRESAGVRDSFLVRSGRVGIEYLDDTVRLVKTFTLRLEVNKEWIPFFAQKTYSAKEILSAKNLTYE